MYDSFYGLITNFIGYGLMSCRIQGKDQGGNLMSLVQFNKWKKCLKEFKVGQNIVWMILISPDIKF